MNRIERVINGMISHYNDKKYWKIKFKLNTQKIKIIRYYYLFRLKKMEAYNEASLGNRVDGGSIFLEKPNLPHGIKGIFISDFSKIGKNCTILQQVTIGSKMPGDKSAPTIGNNVFIGAGAKIIGNITIGDNVKIGANCVVVENIPANSTVVCNKPRIIVKK